MQVTEIIARIRRLVVVSWRGISLAGGIEMRSAAMVLAVACLVAPILAQEKTGDGPTNEKAQKTYQEGMDYLHHRMTELALGSFKKADKQDDGHCLACQQKMVKYGIELRVWKTAETAAEEMLAQAQGEKNVALAHYQFGALLSHEGTEKHKEELFTRAHDEMVKALAAFANFPAALYADGLVLAQLKQDDAAKTRFEEFVKLRPESDPDRQRRCAMSASPSWPGQDWRRRLRSRPQMDSGSRWTI